MTDEVRYERVGAAAVLTIDRPHRRNAVDGPTAERLLEGVEAFEADDGARVLVLTGAGGIAFCAGADLEAIATFARALDLILTGRLVPAPEALALGLVTEVLGRAGPHPLERAPALAEGLAAFPQPTLLADRRAAYDGLGLPLADGLALEARNGAPLMADAAAGAARFAAGVGRGGAGAGA